MKVSKNEESFLISCTKDELIILSNAINNIPQAVDDVEHSTLIGASVEQTNEVLDTLLAAIKDSN